VTHAAVDALHQAAQVFGLRDPARRTAFGNAAVINQLDAEPANGGNLAEHFGLHHRRYPMWIGAKLWRRAQRSVGRQLSSVWRHVFAFS
jgi:hypothetical protein